MCTGSAYANAILFDVLGAIRWSATGETEALVDR